MELTACIHITPMLLCSPLSHEGKNVNNVGYVDSEWKVKRKGKRRNRGK